MRRRAWLLLGSIFLSSTGALAQSSDAGGSSAPTEASPASHGSGSLHLVVFVGSAPAAGVSVTLASGESAVTNENGSVHLTASGGASRELRVAVPLELLPNAPGEPGAGALEVALGGIEIVTGHTVAVIASLSPDGTLESVDIEGAEAAPVIEPSESFEARPKGKISGVVRSNESKLPVEGAQVYVRGAPVEATTDAEGRFSLELPEGDWDISVIHAKLASGAPTAVKVTAAESAEVVFDLLPTAVTLDDFVIRAPHIEGSVASIINERRESATFKDAISAEDISKTPAGDAAGAAQRVVGVTVVDGRFVYVRGLGERYTNALLNGSPLPSPEPDRATVPLDLFPTQTIQSIDISKTFTPDMPADFAGGSVRIETITVPEKLLLSASVSGGYNTQATFRERLSYAGSSTDWLGLDDGTRALSPEVPRGYPLSEGQRKPDGTRLTAGEVDALAGALNTPMGTTNADNPPNHGLKLMLGNGWDVGEDVRFGAVAAMTYSRKYVLTDEIIRQFNTAGRGSETDITRWVDGTAKVARDSIRWAGFGSLGAELGENHELSLVLLHSQLADNTTQLVEFFSQNNNGTYANSRFDFASRTLDFGQLRGRHVFPVLKDAQLDWRLSLSRAALDQPDLRDTVYFRGADSPDFAFSTGSDSGRHFFAEMTENARSAFVDWTQPFEQGELEKTLKAGVAINAKDRVFQARRFSAAFERNNDPRLVCGAVFDPARCPGELLSPVNAESSFLSFLEGTNTTDAYAAKSTIGAGYLMADTVFLPGLRGIYGLRVEATDVSIAQYNQYERENVEGTTVELESTELLPSLSAVYTFSPELELRAALSQTLARPQLRELAPFQFSDYAQGVVVNGNPELDLTTIWNGDLRLDFFPAPREVVSLSVFAKDFTNPIEAVLIPSSSQTLLRFVNARGATLVGAELEVRKGLGFVSEALADFGIMGNLTLATSSIRLDQTGGDASGIGVLTNTNRPMVNQSPYVINLALDYAGPTKTQGRLLYNVSGRQIVEVGSLGLDDSYLQPRHLLDVTISQDLDNGLRLAFSAENILDAPYLVTLGKAADEERASHRYTSGTTFSLSAGYSF